MSWLGKQVALESWRGAPRKTLMGMILARATGIQAAPSLFTTTKRPTHARAFVAALPHVLVSQCEMDGQAQLASVTYMVLQVFLVESMELRARHLTESVAKPSEEVI
mmetsp:Transcript_11879/g.21714  ORF Transcript_11879/g.21714 Transcript_11879/m.21714 type:complete len:107 (+) Transcript_11879:664-984(+)